MDVSATEVAQPSVRPRAGLRPTIAVIGAAVLLATAFAMSRRTVRMTLINHSGGPLSSVRLEYTGGSIDVPDLASGGFTVLSFRPRRPPASIQSGVYETTIHLEAYDGTHLEDRTRSDRLNFWDDRVCTVARLPNGKLAVISHAPGRPYAARVVDRLLGR